MYSFASNNTNEKVIGKPFAAVKVCKEGKDLKVVEFFGAIKADTLVTLLKPGVKVIDGDGKEIKAVGRFYITTETFDPYHLLIDKA